MSRFAQCLGLPSIRRLGQFVFPATASILRHLGATTCPEVAARKAEEPQISPAPTIGNMHFVADFVWRVDGVAGAVHPMTEFAAEFGNSLLTGKFAANFGERLRENLHSIALFAVCARHGAANEQRICSESALPKRASAGKRKKPNRPRPAAVQTCRRAGAQRTTYGFTLSKSRVERRVRDSVSADRRILSRTRANVKSRRDAIARCVFEELRIFPACRAAFVIRSQHRVRIAARRLFRRTIAIAPPPRTQGRQGLVGQCSEGDCRSPVLERPEIPCHAPVFSPVFSVATFLHAAPNEFRISEEGSQKKPRRHIVTPQPGSRFVLHRPARYRLQAGDGV